MTLPWYLEVFFYHNVCMITNHVLLWPIFVLPVWACGLGKFPVDTDEASVFQGHGFSLKSSRL